MDTRAKLEESYVGIMAAEVERFERLCLEERSFGVKIEKAIQEIDNLAQRDVTYAEAKLEACQVAVCRKRVKVSALTTICGHLLTLGCDLPQGKELLPTILTQCWRGLKIVLKQGPAEMRRLNLMDPDLL